MSCRDCRHFDYRFTGKGGRQAGMCRAWGFSINENDDRTCSKKEPKSGHEHEHITEAQHDGETAGH